MKFFILMLFKNDASLKRTFGVDCQRIRADICDIDFDELLPRTAKRVIFVGKHLCGAATCLSLRAIARFATSRPSCSIAITIACCCHHVCSIESLPRTAFTANISPEEMLALKKVSSWAVCGTPFGYHYDSDFVIVRLKTSNYSELLGRNCKKFIDTARIAFFRDHLFDAFYVEYTSPIISLENRAIVAYKGSTLRL